MPYQRVTLGDLKALLQNRLGNSLFWDQRLEIPIYINEALRIWNLMTGQWKDRFTYLTVANQIFYSVSANFLKVMRVTFNELPLDVTSLFSLDNGRPGWQMDSSTPESWFPVGLTQIGLHPADSAGANSLMVEGLIKAPVLTLDTDYLDLGEWQVQALLDYAQHVACFKQGGDEFKMTQPLLQSFVKAAGIQNSKFQQSALYRRFMGIDMDEQQRPVFKEVSGGGGRQANSQ